LKHKLYKLILKIWNKEQLPTQQNERITCPIYKKGDRLNCKNYRPFTLLNIAYKRSAALLNKRLTATLKKMEECQMGVHPNRPTINNIFIIRQIFKKCYEYNRDLHNIFVDYTGY
jgi:hypothetical protein